MINNPIKSSYFIGKAAAKAQNVGGSGVAGAPRKTPDRRRPDEPK